MPNIPNVPEFTISSAGGLVRCTCGWWRRPSPATSAAQWEQLHRGQHEEFARRVAAGWQGRVDLY